MPSVGRIPLRRAKTAAGDWLDTTVCQEDTREFLIHESIQKNTSGCTASQLCMRLKNCESPPRVDSSKSPPRKWTNFAHFLILFGPWRNWPRMAPNGALEVFFRRIQTLPTFWAEHIWILRLFILLFFWIY